MTRVSLGILGPVVPETNAFNLPFVFRDQAHMRKIIDGEIGQEMLDKITNSDFNMVALAWMDGGTRNLYTKKPVRQLCGYFWGARNTRLEWAGVVLGIIGIAMLNMGSNLQSRLKAWLNSRKRWQRAPISSCSTS